MSLSQWYEPLPVPVKTINVATAQDLKNAAQIAGDHDEILMAEGEYDVSDWLDLHPGAILREEPGAHAKIIGNIRMSDGAWMIGGEVTNPDGHVGSLIQANANHCHAINTWAHHALSGYNSLLTGGGPSGGLFYGLICHDTRHVGYLQNGSKLIPKYFIHSYFGDVLPAPVGDNARVLHIYTEQANNGYGMKFYENVISGGLVTLGGQSNATPPMLNDFIGNIFYKANFEGFKRPHESMLKKNRFYRSPFINEFHWGAGEAVYHPRPTVHTQNVYYSPDPSQFNHYVKTSFYGANGSRVDEGVAPLRSDDKVDGNRFYGHFHNSLAANGVFSASIDSMALWRTASKNAGNQFDPKGVFISRKPPNTSWYFPNVYDDSRALLVCANWNGAGVQLDIPGDLVPIRDPYGQPVYAGTGKVLEPEISVWLVRS